MNTSYPCAYLKRTFSELPSFNINGNLNNTITYAIITRVNRWTHRPAYQIQDNQQPHGQRKRSDRKQHMGTTA